MFNSVRFPFYSSGRIPLSSRISGRNSALSVMEIPPVVPQVVSVPISTTHNPVLIPTSSTSTMNEHLSLDTVDQSLYSRIHNSEDGSTFGSCSGSQLLALRALQSTDILSKMQLCYRFFPDHTSFINCTFQVTKKMKKRLKQICKSIGFFSSSIPFYVPEVFQYSNLGQGLEDIAPPMEHFPRFESYHSFFNPETNKELYLSEEALFNQSSA
ncbi:hypothetical protein L1987_89854 [Smallanthus sonchifolius]|nr:hypothetical protein L1987_89854 [Smallanthus sonchifolius]